MQNYFDKTLMEANGLVVLPFENRSDLWCIYSSAGQAFYPLRIIKKIDFSNTQAYITVKENPNRHLAMVHDVGRIGNEFYAEIEYVHGETLEVLLGKVKCGQEKMSEQACIDLILQICEGLQTFHRNGMIHRDIAPKNIIVSNSGSGFIAKIIDYDNAHVTDTSKHRDTTLLGTPTYAAPEQFGFSATDASTDIYALGVLMCELLTGGSLEKIRNVKDKELREIIEKSTKIDKTNRYQTIDQFMSVLRVQHHRISSTNQKAMLLSSPVFEFYKTENFKTDIIHHFLGCCFWGVLALFIMMMLIIRDFLLVVGILGCTIFMIFYMGSKGSFKELMMVFPLMEIIGLGGFYLLLDEKGMLFLLPVVVCVYFTTKYLIIKSSLKILDNAILFYPHNESLDTLCARLQNVFASYNIHVISLDPSYLDIKMDGIVYHIMLERNNQRFSVEVRFPFYLKGNLIAMGKMLENFGIVSYIIQKAHI